MYLYLRTGLDLRGLATHLRHTLNVAATNRRAAIRNQRRYGLNVGGGEYYCFEVLGLVLNLVQNRGEVAHRDRSDYNYYIAVEAEVELSQGEIGTVLDLLQKVLGASGLEVST